MVKRIVALVGSASVPSKTRALAEQAADLASLRFEADAAVYDLRDLQPSLGGALVLDDLDAVARTIAQSVVTADALIVGTPVYKGSYTGLFKHFFDLIDPAALAGKPVLLTATGGGDKHALIVEHQLRPLFAFFEAATLPTAVYANTADFTEGRPSGAALLQRLDRAVAQFAPWLDQRPAQVLAAE